MAKGNLKDYMQHVKNPNEKANQMEQKAQELKTQLEKDPNNAENNFLYGRQMVHCGTNAISYFDSNLS